MDQEQIESYKKAGFIAKEVVAFAKETIKPDMLLIEIANNIDEKITELGAKPAFPVNLSLNEIAAHYTPGNDDKTKAEGLLTIDLGVEINGYIADTAFSLDLTKEKKFQEMINLNQEALEKALSIIKPGIEVGKIGTSIQGTIEKYNKKNSTNFSIIKNLSGHSLGKNLIHAGLTVSNYENQKSTILTNIAIAIEPFLTTGRGEIYEGKPSEIFMLQKESGNPRDSDARKLLAFIKEEYKTKPFCKRWLEKEGFKKIDFSLRTLTRENILHNFPVLIEKTKQPVSQAEHTVLITEGAEVTTN